MQPTCSVYKPGAFSRATPQTVHLIVVLVCELEDDGLQAAAGAAAGGGVEHHQRPVAGVVQVPEGNLPAAQPGQPYGYLCGLPQHTAVQCANNASLNPIHKTKAPDSRKPLQITEAQDNWSQMIAAHLCLVSSRLMSSGDNCSFFSGSFAFSFAFSCTYQTGNSMSQDCLKALMMTRTDDRFIFSLIQLVQTSKSHLQLLMVLDEQVVAGQVALSSQSTHAPAAGCCDGLPPLRVEQVARDKHAIQAGAHLPVMHLQGTTASSCFCLMKAVKARRICSTLYCRKRYLTTMHRAPQPFVQLNA